MRYENALERVSQIQYNECAGLMQMRWHRLAGTQAEDGAPAGVWYWRGLAFGADLLFSRLLPMLDAKYARRDVVSMVGRYLECCMLVRVIRRAGGEACESWGRFSVSQKGTGGALWGCTEV